MADWSELKRLAEFAKSGGEWFVEGCDLYSFYDKPDADFIVDASPDVILSLIAELEQAKDYAAKLEWIIEKRWRPELEKAQAENERLRQSESETIEASFAVVSANKKLVEGRDQLLAEVEGLRKDAGRYRLIADNACDVIMCASMTDYGDGDTSSGPRVEIEPGQYPVEMFGSAKEKLDAAIDAALAKEAQHG